MKLGQSGCATVASLDGSRALYKTVTVVGAPGQYGWSQRLRKGENCIVARWYGGDFTSESDLRSFFDELVKKDMIGTNQGQEFYRAIRALDRGKGGERALSRIRALAKVLDMRVVLKSKEGPVEWFEGAFYMSYWQAYGLARYLKRNTLNTAVRVLHSEVSQPTLAPGNKESKGHPGAYVIRVSPMSS